VHGLLPQQGRGAGLGLAIRCASTSYKTEIRSNLLHANGRVAGEWEERSFNAAGKASGVVSSEQISLQISGAIQGSMTIVQNGSKQSVSIATSGNGLSAVSIGLSKR
jgi:cytoskeletal protein CcmA (bactofilin family)